MYSTGVRGLDLVLGGGIRLISRPGAGAATTIVLRGAPGSGKTVLGAQIGLSIAGALGGDLVYACVEILPPEVLAQIGDEGFRFFRVPVRVFTAPFENVTRASGEPRLFLSQLNVTDGAATRFPELVASLVEEVKGLGGNPKVIVVDSLSDGYGLGSRAPREVCDTLCKFATQTGVTAILQEEAIDETPTSWCFASDVVVDLGREAPSDMATMRRMIVSKNRFGPCDMGPHSYEIASHRGILVYPRVRAYRASWARDLILRGDDWPSGPDPEWRDPQWKRYDALPLPPFRHCVTAVYGSYATAVRYFARRLGIHDATNNKVRGWDVLVEIGRPHEEPPVEDVDGASVRRLVVDDPTISENELMARLIELMEETRLESDDGQRLPVRRVIVGDLVGLRSFVNPGALHRTIGAFAHLMRERRVPVILVDTQTESGPPAVDFADVAISVRRIQEESNPLEDASALVYVCATGRTARFASVRGDALKS